MRKVMNNDQAAPTTITLPSPMSLLDDAHLASFESKVQLIRDRVRGVGAKYQTACYLVGRPGVSKTHTVTRTLDDLGVPWVCCNAKMTPMALFGHIRDHREHILVLDDIGTLFKQEQAMQILMAALDGSPKEPRLVTYKSKDRDEKVLFAGGIVAISNIPLRCDPLAQAFASRAVVLDHDPTDEEMIAFLRNLASKGYKGLAAADCVEVVEFLIVETRELDQRLDLRHYSKALEDFRQDKAGHSKTPWQELVRSSLQKLVEPPSKKHEIALEQERVKMLAAKYPNDVKRQLAESGLKQSTFYSRLRAVRAAA